MRISLFSFLSSYPPDSLIDAYVAGFQVCVTDDVPGAQKLAAKALAVYGTVPSYRAMLDREGLEGPADIAVIGDEDVLAEHMDAIRATGADEYAVSIIARNDDDRERTRAAVRRHLYRALPKSRREPSVPLRP
jgi:hypothetical protein